MDPGRASNPPAPHWPCPGAASFPGVTDGGRASVSKQAGFGRSVGEGAVEEPHWHSCYITSFTWLLHLFGGGLGPGHWRMLWRACSPKPPSSAPLPPPPPGTGCAAATHPLWAERLLCSSSYPLTQGRPLGAWSLIGKEAKKEWTKTAFNRS